MALTQVSRGLLSTSIVDNGNATAITIDANENVGIGASSPAAKLHVSGSFGSQFRLQETGGTYFDIAVGGRFDLKNAAGTTIVSIAQSGSPVGTQLNLDSSGNLGIGTSSPETALHVYSTGNTIARITSGTSNIAGLDLGDTAGTDVGRIRYDNSTNSLAFTTATNEAMRIDSSGRLLVGKTASDGNTDGVELLNSGRMLLTTTSLSHVIRRKSTDGALVEFQKDGTTVGSIASHTGGFLKIDTAGNSSGLLFGTSAIYPIKNDVIGDNAVDLGDGSNRFKDLYLSGIANIGTYLRFGGASNYYVHSDNANYLRFGTAGSERMRIDSSGHLLVGTTSGSTHIIKKAVGVGSVVLEVVGNNLGARFFNADGGTPNAANTAVAVYSVGATGRSVNAAGTVNANGADYAEYERNNGLSISKGSIVGFKADGTLTLTFSEAIRFAVKSTDPSFVGGDTWGTEAQVGAKPNNPTRIEDESDADFESREAEYETDLATFEEALEAARQLVDRIAYSGKVPVNVQGATAGDYIIAVAADDGSINGQAVSDPDFTQYKLAVGRVNRILDDGRAEIAVIIH